MSRFIDAEVMEQRVREAMVNSPHMVPPLIEFIRGIPTADVAEVKHGRWVVIDGTPYCPVCRRQCDYNGDGTHSKSLFYPNCGAKMDGGDKS